MDQNWATMWEAVGAATPDRPALIDDHRTRSHADLDAEASRVAGGLAALGIGEGTPVAFLARNSAEFLVTLYALFKLRAVPLNLNFRYKATELREILDDADAAAVVFEGAFAQRIRAALACRTRPTTLVQLDDPPASPAAHRFRDLAAHAPAPRITRSGRDRLLLYTGGTTGRPKGVVWSHRGLFALMSYQGFVVDGVGVPTCLDELVRAALAAGSDAPRTLSAAPYIHGTGLFFTMLAWLSGGAVVVTATGRAGGFDPAATWDAVTRHRVSQLVIVGDPFAVDLLAALDRPGVDTSGLRRVISAGVGFSDDRKQQMIDRTGAGVLDQVGASEGGPLVVQVVPPGGRAAEHPWVLGPHAALVRDDGTEIRPPSDEIGRFALTGPLPDCYHRDPDATAGAFGTVDGVRRIVTGDLGRHDPAGGVVFLGRGRTVVNTGGEKVYPAEVENALLGHRDVLDVVVVGVPDPRWGETVAAVVAPVPGRRPDAAQLRDHVRATLADYKAPRRVVLVDRVPRTEAGKIHYDRVRALAERPTTPIVIGEP